MRADNSHHIRQAAQRRHELTRSKAVATLRNLENQGVAVTFEAVARAAGVSRSWLYTQPDLRAAIVGLREDGNKVRPRTALQGSVSASTKSLRARLAAALERNRELSREIEHLRLQLALVLGHARRRNASGP